MAVIRLAATRSGTGCVVSNSQCAGDRLGPGEFLVDVAFAVGHHGHARRPGLRQRRRADRRVQPAAALLFREGARARVGPLAAAPLQERRIDQSEQAAIPGIHGESRMQMQAASRGVAAVAQAGGILDHQHVPSRHPRQRAGAGGGDHFARRHSPVMKKPSEAHLASSIDAQRTHPHAAGTPRNQLRQQKGPPLWNGPPLSSTLVGWATGGAT